LSGARPAVLAASSSVSWPQRRAAGGAVPGGTEDVGSATLRLSPRAEATLVVSRTAAGVRRLRVLATSAFGSEEVTIDPEGCGGEIDNPYATWLRGGGEDDRTPSFEQGARVQQLLGEILRRAAA
ncbi:MAG TPA: hypothetical protein VG816_08570, partial [Solirubrobacterales bacterium]|nr:hypothetical protein [Solirubrobacterales bacterium]